MADANADRKQKSGLVKIGVFVKNAGAVPGTEVVRLYIRNTGGSMEQPFRELKGFRA